MKVVLESPIEPHAPALYAHASLHRGVTGFAAVTDEALRHYEDRGFLVVHEALCAEEVEAARSELRQMVLADDPKCESIYYEGAIRSHLDNLGGDVFSDRKAMVENLALGQTVDHLPALPAPLRARYVRKFSGFISDDHPLLMDLAHKRELVGLVERLARSRVRLFQDMAMIKPPGGREKPWHQDHAYFNLPLDTRIVGVWIALDRVTPENGCMHVLAGAHRDGPRLHFMRRDWQICDTDMVGVASTALPMEAGDLMLFDAKLPHGTPTNHTTDYRWALQLHYVPVDAAAAPEQVRLEIFGADGKGVTC